MLDKQDLRFEDKALKAAQAKMLFCPKCKAAFPDNGRPRPPLCPSCGGEMEPVEDQKPKG